MALSTDEDGMERLLESELHDVEVIEALNSKEIEDFIGRDFEVSSDSLSYGILLQSDVALTKMGQFGVKAKLKRLKRKIREFFCEIMKTLDLALENLKTIIDKVLTKLLEHLGFKLPAIIIKILTTVLALLIRKGVERVCPV
ncbi:hypothetical protein [Jiulongibacter sediminis]|uniref:hypothetical protein n=1 Tax=Jiulongibacter sediminis TaxID=1605367 RepID=UPI0026ECA71A|nr:hypothetical protein [Jiulongibacter sediminis]